MANQEHLEILKQGVDAWNRWRVQNPDVMPDLADARLEYLPFRGADLTSAFLDRAEILYCDLVGAHLTNAHLDSAILVGTDLAGARLDGAVLIDAHLGQTILRYADLTGAVLIGALLPDVKAGGAILRAANLTGAILRGADLVGADLTNADVSDANLTDANLAEADLSHARMERSILIRTNLERATLAGCAIFGISTWGVRTADAVQQDLVITPDGEPAITVDDIEVAQFIYLLLNNQNLRGVISTVANRAVLILGRFSAERKVVLDRIKEALRGEGFVPILFDFEPSPARDVTETIQLLANLSRFVIADITDAKSIPQELSHIVPFFPSVPVQPILLASQREYGMFEHWRHYPWVLPEYLYDDADHLIANLTGAVIQPAMKKKDALRDIAALEARNQELEREKRDHERTIEEQQQIIAGLQKREA